MPQKRGDLLYSGVRILGAIMRGNAEATPLYTTRKNIANRRPSVIILWSPLRIRLQPKSLKDRQKYEARHSGKWDNRTTIGPCVLNSFWRAVKPTDPDYAKISLMTENDQREYGIIRTSQGLKRLTYQIVRDLTSGVRQPEHVTEGYDAEKSTLYRQQLVAQQTFQDVQSGRVALSREEVSLLLDGIFDRSVRIYHIDQIYDDRVLRGARLKDQVVYATAQLRFISDELMKFAAQVTGVGGVRADVIFWKLLIFQDQIGSYTTFDVKPKTRMAARLLKQVRDGLDGTMSPPESQRRIFAAAKLAQEASSILASWSTKLSEVA